jgi:molybdate transport system substrate-binding protein
MNLIRKFCLALGLLSVASVASADTVLVAVAANFMAPMNQIATAFERKTGHEVSASFGSTGKLYAQIENGAPFEALLAADEATPKRLVKESIAVPGSRFTYAAGTLALWSAKPDLVDDEGRVLKSGDFAKLAIANPKLAPYGAAAVATMTALGVKNTLEPKFVVGENIAQTFQFVDSGNADLGFVALSQVMKKGEITKGSSWIVPAELHAPIRQDAVVLLKGKERPGVAALMEFLKGDEARAIIRSFGYGV